MDFDFLFFYLKNVQTQSSKIKKKNNTCLEF